MPPRPAAVQKEPFSGRVSRQWASCFRLSLLSPSIPDATRFDHGEMTEGGSREKWISQITVGEQMPRPLELCDGNVKRGTLAHWILSMARAHYFQRVVACAWLTAGIMGGCGDDATRQQGGDAGEQ